MFSITSTRWRKVPAIPQKAGPQKTCRVLPIEKGAYVSPSFSSALLLIRLRCFSVRFSNHFNINSVACSGDVRTSRETPRTIFKNKLPENKGV